MKKKVVTDANQEIASVIPKTLKPSGKLVAEIFGLIFVIALLWSIFGSNIFSLAGTGEELNVGIGWPWTFLTLSAEQSKGLPINFLNLIYDMLLYLVISYILAIAIFAIMSGFKKKPQAAPKSEKEKKIMKNLKKVGEIDKL